jgi:hypothetical protein
LNWQEKTADLEGSVVVGVGSGGGTLGSAVGMIIGVEVGEGAAAKVGAIAVGVFWTSAGSVSVRAGWLLVTVTGGTSSGCAPFQSGCIRQPAQNTARSANIQPDLYIRGKEKDKFILVLCLHLSGIAIVDKNFVRTTIVKI